MGPNDWQQLVYAISHRLPGPARRVLRQEVLWQWLYPAWWQYRLHFLFNRPVRQTIPSGQRRYITIIPGPDGGTAGIGDQLSKWNTALVLALKYNLKLVHHPLVRWWGEVGWDEFLGFGLGELTYKVAMEDASLRKVWLPPLDLKKKEAERLRFVETVITTLYPQDNILFHLGDGTNVRDHSSSGRWLREKYWRARKMEPLPKAGTPGHLIIALHIRRGDLVEMKKSNTKAWRPRWLDNGYFVRIVESVQEALGGRPSEIHVYSEGAREDFPEMAVWQKVVWHLNEDLKQTWHGLVTADVLVTSPSSLSYHAGFLNEGVKIAVYPWWHHIPDGPDWVRSDREGNLDKSALKKAVARLHLNA